VLGRRRANQPGFDYSSAMSAGSGNWTFNGLFEFLRDPQLFVSGTRMSFAGIKDAQQRIDLIAYLRSNVDSLAPVAP
jgi:cytochrome c